MHGVELLRPAEVPQLEGDVVPVAAAGQAGCGGGPTGGVIAAGALAPSTRQMFPAFVAGGRGIRDGSDAQHVHVFGNVGGRR